jgi:hypothetical protein
MLTTDQHKTLIDLLYKLPVGSIRKIDYRASPSNTPPKRESDVKLQIRNTELTGMRYRDLTIRPNGAIVEKQEVEVTIP